MKKKIHNTEMSTQISISSRLSLKNFKNTHHSSILFAIFIISLCYLSVASARQSGIYVDDVDQTVMHRYLDENEKLHISYEILEFLGLAERPRNRYGVSLRKSAPQFLLDVYHRLLEEENGVPSRSKRDTQEQENFITDLDKEAIDQSDIIMTFLNKNHHVDEVRHEHKRRLYFDVSNIADENYLMMAELRIYQNPSLARVKHNHTSDFTISVYSIIHKHEQRELELLSSVNTTSDYHGWLELNVTEGLSKWLQNPKENNGLYLSVHGVHRPEHEIRLDDIGLVHPKGDAAYQPFMIGFFKGPELIKQTKHHSRKKRNVYNTRRRKKSEMINPLTDGHQAENVRSCQMETLYINFKDLGWHDWIIAPESYGAFYCQGECNFPLNAHMNATNHAIVQTLVHLLEPKKVPKPCCAPTKLGALPVLYHQDAENVNLKKYKNMIVKSCGCH